MDPTHPCRPSPVSRTRRLLGSVRGHSLSVIHPLLGRFCPVTLTPGEFQRRKEREVRATAFGPQQDDRAIDLRVLRLALELGFEEKLAAAYLAESRNVPMASATPSNGQDLPSPMCREDRYALYVVTRAIAPIRAVETGVAHGVSSASLLAAMQAGGRGRLISLELIKNDPRIGQVVPPALREFWSIRYGDSLALLPTLLDDLGPIDQFVHDSDHHYAHVRKELELVWPRLRPGGVICVHDILYNNAFDRFIRKHRASIRRWAVKVNFGVILKR